MELKRVKQLADQHWEWLGGWTEKVYKDAFIHGYKHGFEDAKDGDEE